MNIQADGQIERARYHITTTIRLTDGLPQMTNALDRTLLIVRTRLVEDEIGSDLFAVEVFAAAAVQAAGAALSWSSAVVVRRHV